MVNATSSSNTALGKSAGGAVTTGGDNTILGYQAGASMTTCANTVCIGSNADPGNNSNKVMIYNGTVNANFSGSASSWTFTSDGRDKTDIVDLDLGLDFIKKIQPRKFKWDFRDEKRASSWGNGLTKAGFIAQELQAVLSEANATYTGIVDETDPDNLTVGQTDFIPMLINAVKELSAEVEQLKSQINN